MEFLKAKNKIEWFCAYQERAFSEVHKKLSEFELSEENIEKLFNHLIDNNFLNELRFAEAYVSGKLKIKHWGRFKIRMGLLQKKVDKSIISNALSEIDQDVYLEVLNSIAERKWKELNKEKDLYKRKAKCFLFLQSRGFESDLISNALKEINENNSL